MTRSRKLTVAHATISLKTLLRLSCTPPLGLHSLKGAFYSLKSSGCSVEHVQVPVQGRRATKEKPKPFLGHRVGRANMLFLFPTSGDIYWDHLLKASCPSLQLPFFSLLFTPRPGPCHLHSLVLLLWGMFRNVKPREEGLTVLLFTAGFFSVPRVLPPEVKTLLGYTLLPWSTTPASSASTPRGPLDLGLEPP